MFVSVYDFIMTIFFPNKIQLRQKEYKYDDNKIYYIEYENGTKEQIDKDNYLKTISINRNYIPPSLKIDGKEMFKRLNNTSELIEDCDRRGYRYTDNNGVIKFISEEELGDW
jgi:predicted methyltransferase